MPEVGTWPQWISAIAAFVALLGAAWILFRVGHRANLSVRGEVVESAVGYLLVARVRVEAVGRWEVRPPIRLPCEEHGCASDASESAFVYRSWDVDPPPLDAESVRAELRGLSDRGLKRRTRKLFRRARHFDDRRRDVWGCPNQKQPRVMVEELRRPEALTLPEAVVICDRRNALMGQWVSTGETSEFAHVFVLGEPDPEVIAWRVVFEVWMRRWNWFRHLTSVDCWWWTAIDVVARPSGNADGVADGPRSANEASVVDAVEGAGVSSG